MNNVQHKAVIVSLHENDYSFGIICHAGMGFLRLIINTNIYMFLGPDKWLHAFPNAAGTRQSPVDIVPFLIKAFNPSKKLSWIYEPETTASVMNSGYGWKVDVSGKGSGKEPRKRKLYTPLLAGFTKVG